MRAIWSGVVSFGLVSVPVRVYSATSNHDVRFHQVHDEDGGQIRYKRVCEVCGKEVAYADIAKGYQTEDGELVTLDSDDMASLPLSSSREIEVVEFVPAEQVDPLLLDKSYYLEPDAKAVKPYALLREALRKAERMAVVKVALRQRETLALLRVRDEVIVLQTMLWPDEVREPDFETLGDGVDLRPQELQMASMLVNSLGADFEPTQFEDAYTKAVEDLIEYKREHGGARPAPVAATAGEEPITDLLTALKRSVEEARSGRAKPADADSDAAKDKPAAKDEPAAKTTRKPAAPKTPAKTSAKSGTPAKTTAKSGKTAAAKPPAKATPAKASAKTPAKAPVSASAKAQAKAKSDKAEPAKKTGTRSKRGA